MKIRAAARTVRILISVLAVCGGVARAKVRVTSLRPSLSSPQTIGTTVSWMASATDSNAGPLTFQFNVAAPGGSFSMARDFNVGKLETPTWKPPARFNWTPVGSEGIYQIQVVAKDFVTGEMDSRTVSFQVTPLATGDAPVVAGTANPLVALFSTPSCAAGSSIRAWFQPANGSSPATTTNWAACQPNTITFEIAGMYASTAYQMFSQIQTGSNIENSAPLTFTTGAIPARVRIPKFKDVIPPGPETDTIDGTILHGLTHLGAGPVFAKPATDLSGNILWYYYPFDSAGSILTRPLPNQTFLTIEDGPAWNSGAEKGQFLHQIDLAGNIIRETNTGVIQQSLLKLGAIDAQPCNVIPKPAPIGSACLGAFHHEFIASLPDGYSAAIADIEKIFPAGTQGDASGLPVDIVGDMIVVLDPNWQAVWYFDTFEHAGGAPQLDITRPAVLGETCVVGQAGCPNILLLGSGIAPTAKDWLHANSLYYWPQTHDIIWSSRHQDWVMRIDYQDRAGTGNILWRMGLNGDFTFNNITNDPYPWFSHQHEAGIEQEGAGPLTLFDNGNTRVEVEHTGNSRGMALTFDKATMQVTPVLSQDLGVYAGSLGSAQLLSNGNYFFAPGVVIITLNIQDSYAMEVLPNATGINGTLVLKQSGPEAYRGWQMPSLYDPPTT